MLISYGSLLANQNKEFFKKEKILYKLEIKKAKTELEHCKGQLMENLLNKNNTKPFRNEWKKIIKKGKKISQILKE